MPESLALDPLADYSPKEPVSANALIRADIATALPPGTTESPAKLKAWSAALAKSLKQIHQSGQPVVDIDINGYGLEREVFDRVQARLAQIESERSALN